MIRFLVSKSTETTVTISPPVLTHLLWYCCPVGRTLTRQNDVAETVGRPTFRPKQPCNWKNPMFSAGALLSAKPSKDPRN